MSKVKYILTNYDYYLAITYPSLLKTKTVVSLTILPTARWQTYNGHLPRTTNLIRVASQSSLRVVARFH